MKRLVSCEYNMDTNCVELVYTDGIVIAIDVNAVEYEYAEDMYQRSPLKSERFEWLDMAGLERAKGIAELVMKGEVRKYLKEVTEYRRLE